MVVATNWRLWEILKTLAWASLWPILPWIYIPRSHKCTHCCCLPWPRFWILFILDKWFERSPLKGTSAELLCHWVCSAALCHVKAPYLLSESSDLHDDTFSCSHGWFFFLSFCCHRYTSTPPLTANEPSGVPGEVSLEETKLGEVTGESDDGEGECLRKSAVWGEIGVPSSTRQ